MAAADRVTPAPATPGWLALPRWPGWHQLPRDARDTLFLLGVIAWTVMPHLGHLPWWCGALTGLVLLWRGSLALSNAKLPGRASIIAVLAVAAGLTFWSERTLLGQEAGVTMLVVLMALKMLELRARRDALVVFFLGFFLVLTHFLYSQTLLTAVAMLGSVWGLLTALVLAHMPVGRPSLRRAGWLAARTALLGAPVMLVLFVLFPRIGPLWGVPNDAKGRIGLSDRMQIGQVAELANDDSVAFRVRFTQGRTPPPNSLYFRGPVLTLFDGRTWKMDPGNSLGAPMKVVRPLVDLQPTGPAVPYEITLEPQSVALLPVLDATADLPDTAPQVDGVQLTPLADLSWLTAQPIRERVRYNAVAWPQFRHGRPANALALRPATRLPPGVNPRMMAWAAELRSKPGLADADARTLAAELMTHIRQQNFTYTLSPGSYGVHAVDEFWFDRRLGFCEHFTAAFVVAMRAMDVPARVVLGYQGADPVPVDGYYVVRQNHAHAWAEYWQPGEGWIRADPTAAVAPDRIDRSTPLRPEPGLVAGAIESFSPEALLQLRQAWETMNNRWNQWVLNYSRQQQFDLLKRLGMETPDWADLGRVLIAILVITSLAGAAWAWWDRHRQDPWQRLFRQVRDELAALRLPAEPHHPPRTLADMVRGRFGEAGQPLADALERLDQARYGPQALASPEPAWWRDFARHVRNLKPTQH